MLTIVEKVTSFQYSDHSEFACCCWWQNPQVFTRQIKIRANTPCFPENSQRFQAPFPIPLFLPLPVNCFLGNELQREMILTSSSSSRSQWRVWVKCSQDCHSPALPHSQSVSRPSLSSLVHAAHIFAGETSMLYLKLSWPCCSSLLKTPMTLYCCKNEVLYMHLAITSEPAAPVLSLLFNLPPLLSILSQEEICT